MRHAAVALLISLIVPAIVLTTASTSALANPKPTGAGTGASAGDIGRAQSQMVTDDCALARKAGKTCVLDVPAEDVGGKVPTVDDVGVRILTFGKSGSLIRVRHDFIPEIVKTAEDL